VFVLDMTMGGSRGGRCFWSWSKMAAAATATAAMAMD
jgi:hypothetical protein